MGLFSSKNSSGATRRASSDAQMHEMRSRARRRLIGALVLVLAAVLIVPFLTSNEPQLEAEQGQLLAVIPASPLTENNGVNQAIQQPPVQPQTETEVVIDDLYSGTSGAEEPPLVVEPKPETTPIDPPAVAPTEPPVVKKPPEPVKAKEEVKPVTPPKKVERTDDGAVALALLEGRTPPTTTRTAPVAKPQGNFILQIVAYSAQSEAQSRRNQLVSAGVTNAYVETANSAGKTTYRLRVGPFPTREAAQAAQTRLRSLGYENSFISTK